MLSILFILLQSCSAQSYQFSFYTSHNFPLYSESGISENKESVEYATEVLIEVLSEMKIYSEDRMYDVLANRAAESKIFVKNKQRASCSYTDGFKTYITVCEGFRCKYGPYGWCTGQYRTSGEIEYVYEKCIANSSLVHELIHFFDYEIDNFVDSMHKNKQKFKYGCLWYYPKDSKELLQCMANTAENVANYRIQRVLCPPEKE